MTPLAKQLMKENTAVIASILYKNGIEKVVLTYSGMGDSGNGIDIEEIDGEEAALKHKLNGVELRYEDRYSRSEDEKIRASIPYTVREALEQYVDNFTDMFQPGYEINEGGGGTVTFYRHDEKSTSQANNYGYRVAADTYINIITEEHTGFTF